MISWNVNGIRACVSKGFLDSMQAMDADIICLQETKVQAGQIELDEPPLTNYHQYWNYAQRKGYSGTAIFTKEEPRSVQLGLGIPEHDTEGRVITRPSVSCSGMPSPSCTERGSSLVKIAVPEYPLRCA